MTVKNREDWLALLIDEFRHDFSDVRSALPEKVHVSVGWPSRGGTTRRKRVVGECFDGCHSEDGFPHIFISPLIPREEADHTLVHELVHAALPKAKHGKEFRRVAVAVGLEGKMSATHAGETLRKRLDAFAERIGPYPHPTLALPAKGKRKPPSSFFIQCECQPKRKLRVTKQEKEQGPILCLVCNKKFRHDADPEPYDDESATEKLNESSQTVRQMSVEGYNKSV